MDCDTRPWAGLSAEEHEFHFNPQRAFPHFAIHRERRAPANAEALSSLDSALDIAYGDNLARRLDIFPARAAGGATAPVHVFFHGGYWRAQDKANFAYIAGALVPQGVTTVVANYELCPASTLDGVVDSALAAVEWIGRNIGRHGGDPERISISGHSAGAHLCAEILATDWRSRGLAPDIVKGAVLISGIYDPAPARLTTVNEQLRLTDEVIARHDVERRRLHTSCPVSLFAGGLEPWHWIDQTFRYSHHLRRQGSDPAVHVLPGYDHFDIIDAYRDSCSLVESAVLRPARGPAPATPKAVGA